MPSYEASLSIAAPRDAVWLVLSTVVAWAEWLPTVNKVQPLDGDSLKVGSRYTLHQPRLRPATWVVTELEAPRRFVWEARSPGLVMVASHTIDESSRGKSLVSLRFSFGGLLGGPIGWLFGSLTERYLAQELASLKALAEKDFPSREARP